MIELEPLKSIREEMKVSPDLTLSYRTIVLPDGKNLCRMHDTETNEAYARLFVAAADLLAACETIVHLGKSRYHDLGIDRMVEAAIAKAKGGGG